MMPKRFCSVGRLCAAMHRSSLHTHTRIRDEPSSEQPSSVGRYWLTSIEHRSTIPTNAPMHGLLDSWSSDCTRHDIIELHDDIGPDLVLKMNRLLGRQQHVVAVVRRAESHALLGDVAERQQRHHLEAARVCEMVARPVHEVVQSSHRIDHVAARSLADVIRVGQHDIAIKLQHKVR